MRYAQSLDIDSIGDVHLGSVQRWVFSRLFRTCANDKDQYVPKAVSYGTMLNQRHSTIFRLKNFSRNGSLGQSLFSIGTIDCTVHKSIFLPHAFLFIGFSPWMIAEVAEPVPRAMFASRSARYCEQTCRQLYISLATGGRSAHSTWRCVKQT